MLGVRSAEKTHSILVEGTQESVVPGRGRLIRALRRSRLATGLAAAALVRLPIAPMVILLFVKNGSRTHAASRRAAKQTEPTESVSSS